ncbi:MAG: MoxR family ATPase [Marinovum sp.]|nr:MoxR family ATPase [Marinovum sp.]
MSVNTHAMGAGRALEVLHAGWAAQDSGGLISSWMLHGRPGIGKSQIVATLAEDIGARLFDLRLTTIEPQDLRGLPYYDHETRKTVWYRPEDLPDDTGSPSILFLDELTAAAPHLQPTVYGLLQERRVGQHVLPKSVMIIAAGNTVDDGAVAYEMGTALSDRLIHLQVVADAKDWLEHYAVQASIAPAVSAFLRARPDLLDTTETTLRRGETIACTPRAWERVSQIMLSVSDKSLRMAMIAGTVGAAPAAEFGQVAEEIEALVAVDELLSLPRSKRSDAYPKTLNGLVGLIYALVTGATAESLPDTIECMADIADVPAPTLPLGELRAFGFELLIRKALDQGLEEVFRLSTAYADYAATRAETGAL